MPPIDNKIYKTLFEEAMDMIFIIDSNGVLIDVNNEMCHKLDYAREELIGKSMLDFVHPSSIEQFHGILASLEAGKSERKYGLKLNNKLGKTINGEVSSVPEMNDKEMNGAFSIIRDVSDIRRNSVELNRMNKQLIEKNRELEQIVYVTSHDLRSPLVNIQGFNQELEVSIEELKKLLSGIDLPERLKNEINEIFELEIKESIDYIQLGIVKMDKLLKGLLTISRLGRRPLEIKEINMNNFISGIIKSFDFQLKENEIEIDISELPSCKADELQFSQVLSNLIDNSIKYLKKDQKGIISISGSSDENTVSYLISDNGIGIPPEKREKVFEIFYRDEQEQAGEGLGLTLVRKVIDKHMGDVSIESNSNGGTLVRITLPK